MSFKKLNANIFINYKLYIKVRTENNYSSLLDDVGLNYIVLYKAQRKLVDNKIISGFKNMLKW